MYIALIFCRRWFFEIFFLLVLTACSSSVSKEGSLDFVHGHLARTEFWLFRLCAVVRLSLLSESSSWVITQVCTCKFHKGMPSVHSRNALLNGFPWLLRWYRERWLPALGLESAFRAPVACDGKTRKVTLGESLLRHGVAVNTVPDF